MFSGKPAPLVVYGFLVSIGLIGGVGDILIYKWAKFHHPFWLLLASATWLFYIVLFGLFLRLEHFSFAIAIVIATVIHLVMSLIWGIFFTDAKLNRIELAGLILGILAVVLLEIGHTLNSGDTPK